MINLLVEAALRSCVLGAALVLALILTRSRNPHVHKLVVSAMLIASLAMPLLIQVRVMPAIQAPDYVLTLQAQASSVGVTQSSAAWNGIDALYLSVAFGLIWRYVRSLVTMWRIRHDAQPVEYTSLTRLRMTNLDIRVTARVRSPATFGATILLPADFVEWPHEKLTAVLAHERAHVLDKDCYLLWLARLHTCIFWFNPLAWWLRRKLALLSETTSDEAAVAVLGDKPAYAEILLEFATHRAVSDVATAMARPRVVTRIERVLSELAPSAMPRPSQRIAIIAAVFPIVAAASAPLEQMPTRIAQSGTLVSGTASRMSEMDQPPRAPSIKAGLSLAELMKYYPPEAERNHVEGVVNIRVTLDAQGRATDTLILSEDPLGMGFGAAASALAHVMEYNNPMGRPTDFNFKVKFALGTTPPASGTTNFESPDQP